MKFKGQGEINICGFEYKKNIADSRRGGGPSTPPPKKKTPVSAPELRITETRINEVWLYTAHRCDLIISLCI